MFWTWQFKSAHSADSKHRATAVCALHALQVTSLESSSRLGVDPEPGLRWVLLVCLQLRSVFAVQIHAKPAVPEAHRVGFCPALLWTLRKKRLTQQGQKASPSFVFWTYQKVLLVSCTFSRHKNKQKILYLHKGKVNSSKVEYNRWKEASVVYNKGNIWSLVDFVGLPT